MFNTSKFIRDGNTINILEEKISVLCNDGIFGYIDTYDFITWATDGVNARTVRIMEINNAIIEDHNNYRPSYALQYKTPIEYRTQLGFN